MAQIKRRLSKNMGSVVQFPRHTGASSTGTGRATSIGQSKSSGQRSENQRITSSYFRAVKVLPSSSNRSKKRQSPAAKRPIVAILTDRDVAYADAQAMRFDRSSVSIVGDDSRKIPTLQADFVGNFRLANNSDTSDKSAMSSADEVRNRVRQAFTRTGESPITLAQEWEFERNHIRDFLDGKKDSLKPEILQNISEHFQIPFNLLIIKRKKKKKKAA